MSKKECLPPRPLSESGFKRLKDINVKIQNENYERDKIV